MPGIAGAAAGEFRVNDCAQSSRDGQKQRFGKPPRKRMSVMPFPCSRARHPAANVRGI
jgi:hypothetical protein